MPFVLAITLSATLVALAMLVNHRLKRQRQKLRRQENEVWSIGLYEGPDPITLSPMDGIHNPILTAGDITDAPARFVADPFMVEHDGTYNLFFEFLNTQRKTGEIGHALSRDMKTWTYTGTVLSEKFHLSYPYVFRHEGEMYMIPECAKSKSIRLYRATNFPGKWEPVTTIIKGDKRQVPLLDPSVVHHNGKWYLFSYMRKVNNLHLFVADSLEGPWKEHPKSPIVTGSDHFARPGGRVVADGEVLYRYAQDGVPRYGSKAWAFRITELTPSTYREEQASSTPVVQQGNEAWNNRGMHTVDPHQMPDGRWIAFVDGLEHRHTLNQPTKQP